MFVECHEFAENLRRQSRGKNRVRGAVALEHAVGDEPIRRAFGSDFLRRLPKCQSLGLSEDVRQKHVMVAPERIERLSKRDEVAGDKSGPLMDQLIKGVLSVRSGLAPINWACR